MKVNYTFDSPYVAFYPTVSLDGQPIPINKAIHEMKGSSLGSSSGGRDFDPESAWRGNIIVAKYSDCSFLSMTNATVADFPIVKNYLITHVCFVCIFYHAA